MTDEESFPLSSVWEADADATGQLTTFVVVKSDGLWREALVLRGSDSRRDDDSLTFYFHTDWPFCRRCVRIV